MRHDVTGVSLVSREALEGVFTGQRYVGVQVGPSGGLSGETVLIFDPGSAERLRKRLQSRGDDESLVCGAFTELGNIAIGGFVDGWANALESSIEQTPPEFVRDSGAAVIRTVQRRLPENQEYAFTIDTTIEIADREAKVQLYVLPDTRELAETLSAHPAN